MTKEQAELLVKLAEDANKGKAKGFVFGIETRARLDGAVAMATCGEARK